MSKKPSPSRRRWLDRQRERARLEAQELGTEVDSTRSKWAYSTRSDPQPPKQR